MLLCFRKMWQTTLLDRQTLGSSLRFLAKQALEMHLYTYNVCQYTALPFPGHLCNERLLLPRFNAAA